jgi:hypothetical protein
MTTPHDPNQPVDPTQPVDPNQPYGQPPQYGAPQPPQYGAPAPQYGTPQYGAPAGGAPYGTPMPPQGEQPPSKGLAIAALVTAILGCFGITWLISVVLAIVVLVKGKDGRNHGKGLAIAALVIDALYLLGTIVFVVLAVVVSVNTTSVSELSTGDCITANGLSGAGDTVDKIKVVDCDTSHDGEVLFTKSLSQDEADTYSDNGQNSVCTARISDDPALTAKMSSQDGLNVLALTQSLPPDPGDKVACVAYLDDGSKLSAPLG